MPSSYLQRKYVDLILEVSSKWVNWDPPINVRVGSFGTIDKQTGDLLVEGSIYDPEFQDELDKVGAKVNMADHPPQPGPVEGDFVIVSRGAKRQDGTDKTNDQHGSGYASIGGQWLLERGKRNAILIMHNPRQTFLPRGVVLEQLYQVNKLANKHLVTSIHTCPAYSMYLSDKLNDRISIALVAQPPAAGVTTAVAAGTSRSFAWQVNPQTGLLRKACNQAGDYIFTPLYSLRRPIRRTMRFFRDAIHPEPSGDELWHPSSPPWDPLDEDGVEDPLSPVSPADQVDLFTHITSS